MPVELPVSVSLNFVHISLGVRDVRDLGGKLIKMLLIRRLTRFNSHRIGFIG